MDDEENDRILNLINNNSCEDHINLYNLYKNRQSIKLIVVNNNLVFDSRSLSADADADADAAAKYKNEILFLTKNIELNKWTFRKYDFNWKRGRFKEKPIQCSIKVLLNSFNKLPLTITQAIEKSLIYRKLKNDFEIHLSSDCCWKEMLNYKIQLNWSDDLNQRIDEIIFKLGKINFFLHVNLIYVCSKFLKKKIGQFCPSGIIQFLTSIIVSFI